MFEKLVVVSPRSFYVQDSLFYGTATPIATSPSIWERSAGKDVPIRPPSPSPEGDATFASTGWCIRIVSGVPGATPLIWSAIGSSAETGREAARAGGGRDGDGVEGANGVDRSFLRGHGLNSETI